MKGKCYYCQKDLTERTVKRHIKNCPAIKEKIDDELNTTKATRNQFIISIKPRYDKSTYCIYLSIDENLQLQHLDKFIRDVWVECCGHLSSFHIDGIKYDDNSNDLYQMNVKLKEVLSIGEKFEYEYDFGDTTYLTLEVVDKIKVSKKHSQIEILARNNENDCTCSKCKNKAEYYRYTTGDFLCEKCAQNVDEDEIEELYGDYFNSPRDGVCGYVGDKDAELPYMPGNNNKYKVSRNKPQLFEDEEYDFGTDGLYENDADDDLLNDLLSYADSCNGHITEDDINDFLQEKISELQSDFNEAFYNFAYEVIKRFEKGVFSFDLDKLLNGYTKVQLAQLTQRFGIKVPSNANKNTYIKKLLEVYPVYIKNEIYNLDEDKYKKLQKCIKNKGLITDIEEYISNYMFLIEKGFLFPVIHDQKPACIMPHLIQEIFKKMNNLEVRNKIKNNTEVINLFRGMIKAYGILGYDNTLMLLKRYINDFDEINVIYMLKDNEEYYFDEYKVIEQDKNLFGDDEIKLFVNSNIDNYENLLSEIDKNLDYSYISKDELISMSAPNYLEKSNLGKKFLRELTEMFVVKKEDAIYNMNMLALDVQTRNINEILNDVLSGFDFDMTEAERFSVEQLFGTFLKNIPLWKFKGASINQQNAPKQEDDVVNKKIGRNELCPCGSGKKYKNCCGKVIELF
ncbi:SEC-C metal-binding domain-containing protein [Clostridium sp. SM-530-WT-3G]|uniref:SEC-C metal-binding domain-containing protein n=1 Tax=Clostridium sp. SM-530-WT-3G TaxID=2725303 RepID=UPI00145EB279|nr:SEC-C metal-binding domain-containing protein [Clostridium sp. SM-530-WT-3G]NME83300.1 SecC motif-containing protein [Clostridium sp. SM-530-WT-3G]